MVKDLLSIIDSIRKVIRIARNIVGICATSISLLFLIPLLGVTGILSIFTKLGYFVVFAVVTILTASLSFVLIALVLAIALPIVDLIILFTHIGDSKQEIELYGIFTRGYSEEINEYFTDPIDKFLGNTNSFLSEVEDITEQRNVSIWRVLWGIALLVSPVDLDYGD